MISYAPPGGGLLVSNAEQPARGPLGMRAKAPPPAVAAPGAEEEERRASYYKQIDRLRAEISTLKQEIEAERQRFQMKGGDTAMLAMSAPFTVQVRRTRERRRGGGGRGGGGGGGEGGGGGGGL